METRFGEKPKVVFLFDNSFLDFLYNMKIDLGIFDFIKECFDVTGETFDLIIITKEVYEKSKERKYEFPFGEVFEKLYENWENLKGILYEDIDIFIKEYKAMRNFIKRAINCFQTHVEKEEIDLFTSALLLKNKQFNPIIVSDDKRFLFYSDIISSYFGSCLRFFSTFEFLTYLDRFKFREELSQCNDYFDLRMTLNSLDNPKRIERCEDHGVSEDEASVESHKEN